MKTLFESIKKSKILIIAIICFIVALIMCIASFAIAQSTKARYVILNSTLEERKEELEKIKLSKKEYDELLPELQDAKKKADDLESKYNKINESLETGNTKIETEAKTKLEELYKKKRECIENTKWTIAEADRIIYNCILRTNSNDYIDDTDYLAEAISEITGHDIAGDTASAIVSGLKNGNSFESVLGEVVDIAVDDAIESTKDKIISEIVGEFLPSEVIDGISLAKEISAGQTGAKKAFLRSALYDNNFYWYEVGYHLDQEELSIKDYQCLISDLKDFQNIMGYSEVAKDAKIWPDNLEEEIELIKGYQKDKSEIDAQIALYEGFLNDKDDNE